MGKFTGVLLCSDYDNTIVDTAAVMRGEIEEALPGEKTLQAVEYFMAEGGRFAVATGRALAAFIKQAKTIPMNAPAVLYNGAALADGERFKLDETYTVEVQVEGDAVDAAQLKASINGEAASVQVNGGVITVSCDMVCVLPAGGMLATMDLGGWMPASGSSSWGGTGTPTP